MASMNSLLKKADALLILLEKTVEKRDETYYDRSEKWQESEKGTDYHDQTNTLGELVDSLHTFCSDMNDHGYHL